MEFNVEVRKKQLHSLKQYIRSSEENVKAAVQSLGWTSSKTLQDEEPKILCPLNKNHLIPQQTLKKHLEKCSLRSAGYEGNEDFLSEPPSSKKCCVKISNAKKAEIIGASRVNRSEFRLEYQQIHLVSSAWNGRDSDPLTSDRFTSTFSVDERSALYEYSIKHAIPPPKPQEFTLDLTDIKEKKGLTEKERLLLERDAKRRRAKYKSVHTSKKSQTEIMRELIDNQMTLFTDWLKAKQEKERVEKENMKRLSREKLDRQSWTDQSQEKQYQYIGTTYDQPFDTQSMTDWNNQSASYPSTYSQYAMPSSDGIITDWSHLYQGGLYTEFDANTDPYQADIREYTDSKSSLDPANLTYANYSQSEKFDSTSEGLNSYQIADEKRREDRKVPSLVKDALKEHERRRAGSHVKYENVKKTRNFSNNDDIL
ncbi:U11/U12 small nuclear ribonucleoprotein 48 kDa protein [Dendroctonus ponderosae]|uniref:U11/U12 small nuclear ribonucleoprotein 48 kDa protein n=1 Tax=Dendroctonus ponderosae TaxID=77166 RepID=UPI0020359F37|nr:U11/U12 small nuclear ribonucleoprotein 48 kDa protein [Dendroctonus ponderosae]